MQALASAALGFLLAVLWFDLMFDVQVWPYRAAASGIPEPVVESIARYYRRVTTDATPMNRLVPLAMLCAIAGIIGQLVDDGARWNLVAALIFAIAPITYAGVRIVPMAKRLAARTDDIEQQRILARTILIDHVLCVGSIAIALILQFV